LFIFLSNNPTQKEFSFNNIFCNVVNPNGTIFLVNLYIFSILPSLIPFNVNNSFRDTFERKLIENIPHSNNLNISLSFKPSFY